MKKIVYCEGVDESWMTDSDNPEYADEKTPYFESGPYYLAFEVDAQMVRKVDHEADLSDLEHELEGRIAKLEKALRDIAAIENEMIGGDWEEIEKARQIANTALMVK